MSAWEEEFLPEINFWEGGEGFWSAEDASPEELAYAYEGGWGEDYQQAATEYLVDAQREEAIAEHGGDMMQALDRGAVDIEQKLGREMTQREFENYVKGAQMTDIAGAVKEAVAQIQTEERTPQGRLQVMTEEAEANGLGAGRKSWTHGEDREEPEEETETE